MDLHEQDAAPGGLTGALLVGGEEIGGGGTVFHAIDPRTGQELPTTFASGRADDVARACALAAEAARPLRALAPEDKARFLEAIASEIEAIGDVLIERASAESGLPPARLQGERGRTIGQLRLFATTVRAGDWIEARIDPALPDRKPLPRPDLRQRHIPVGPVAVFGASNFPLAFSVAGGDTASAFAAGCPVVAKAHPAHPGTSELVGRAVARAVRTCGLPAGTFSLVGGTGNEVGLALVADPRIKAVGFTGSRTGGLALVQAAAARPEPIPVFAEMSSVNPTILLPGALAERGEAIARGLIASVTLGAGQFCTNPGLVLALEGPSFDNVLGVAASAMRESVAATMLTPGIHKAYLAGIEQIRQSGVAEELATSKTASGPFDCEGALFVVDADGFLAQPGLQAEVFGSASLVVRCADLDALERVLLHLEGQLTATIHMADGDADAARRLMPLLEEKVGRILFNGFPTGVEVSPAMVHGGPFPATSDGRTTSVGTLAIRRFLRPVCYQDTPAALLPEALRDENPYGLRRLVDGRHVGT